MFTHMQFCCTTPHHAYSLVQSCHGEENAYSLVQLICHGQRAREPVLVFALNRKWKNQEESPIRGTEPLTCGRSDKL